MTLSAIISQLYQMSLLDSDKYVRRTSSTVPFGYELSPIDGYLTPIPEQLSILKEVAASVHADEISLGIGVDWLEAETGRKMSRAGLKKHTDKVYGRLVKKS